MALVANGLGKLIEECGELIQVAGKKLAYYHVDNHPDGGPPLSHRLEDEIADVLAIAHVVMMLMELDIPRIKIRTLAKVDVFMKWYGDRTDAHLGVDAPTTPRRSTPT